MMAPYVVHINTITFLCESQEQPCCFESPKLQAMLFCQQVDLLLLSELVILQYVDTNPSEKSFFAGV